MEENIEKDARDLSIETRAFIGGRFVDAIDLDTIKKVSPIDSNPIPSIASCKSQDIANAVEISQKAFESKVWLGTTPHFKKECLLRLASLMEKYHKELALLDTLETGRTFKNYYNDSIPKAITTAQYFAEAIDKYYDHSIPPRANACATITKEALGVVGLITPWNDPLVVAMWKMVPALLMGNSVVLKPAEQSTYSILKVAKLAQQAGIPDGVLNVVPGYGEIAGKSLALHQDVRGIFFTGSSEIGKKILTYAGESNMKKVGLECGGKSPFIVTKHCKNIERAAQVLAKNVFYNQGQICSAPSRAIIDIDIKDQFIDHLQKETRKYVPANPFNINSEVGCVVSKEQKEKILAYIEKSKTSAKSVFVPNLMRDPIPGGQYILPTIIEIDDPRDTIAQEEIFGPVLAILSSSSSEEALAISNDSKYGLAASIWSDDINEAYYFSRNLQAGIVHINSYGDDDNTVPFGGIKESGIGKDKSIFAFDEYSYTKTTWISFDQHV